MIGNPNQDLGRNSIQLLASMVLLAQLPLAFHVPIWLSLPSMIIVLIRAFADSNKALVSNPIITGSLTLIGAVGIFISYGHMLNRDPCVAFLFMLIGFKFAETRRQSDAALLIILCVFLLLTQFFYWQSIAAAMLTIPALLFIGLALFQLQRHPVQWRTREAVRLTSTLYLQAIPVALLLFLIVPRINAPGWGQSGHATTGLTDRMSIGTVSSLVKSPEVAMRVEFDDHVPSPAQRYWRGPVLSGFDGDNWFSLPASYSRNQMTGDNRQAHEVGQPASYTVTMTPSYQRWMPVLEVPALRPVKTTAANARSTTLNGELVALSTRRLNRTTGYRASSYLNDRFTPSARPGPEYLITTASNPRSREFGRQMRARFSDDLTLINSLLTWYNHQSYHYTLAPVATGTHNAIDEFFFNTQAGFCEHFASSFVFILRAAGIPARIVTGYLGGELNEDYMIVRQSDAHAWAEAYVDGQWRRFDPTAAVAPERVEQGIESLGDAAQLQSLADRLVPKALILKWDAINYGWQRFVIGFDRSSQAWIWRVLGVENVSGWLIASAVFALLLLTILGLTNLDKLTRHHRESTPVERQWRLFCKLMKSHGCEQRPGESASGFVCRMKTRWPAHSTALSDLLEHYLAGRFSHSGEHNPRWHRQRAAAMATARKQLRLSPLTQ